MKNFLILFTLVFSTMAFSQEKVLEASARKSPEWVNGMTEDYIITYAYGADVDEAKNNLQMKIREEIVSAVATYVRSSSEINIENEQRGNIVNSLTQFQKKSTIQTGDVPFLKGISLSKAEDFYWVKTKNKKTDEISVTYHIKYNFSQSDLHRLIKEFEAQDQAMTDKMNTIIAVSKNPKSVEELQQCIRQLESLHDYFIDARKEAANIEILRCKESLKAINLEVLQNKPGLLKYQLVLGETPIATAQKPKVRGTMCVQSIMTKKSGPVNAVEYNYENCFEDEENSLTVEHRISSNTIRQTVPVQVKDIKVEMFVKDPIRLTKKTDDGKNVTSFSMKVPVVAKYSGSFAINKITLELAKGISIEIADIFEEFSSKGVHEFMVNVEQNIPLEAFMNSNNSEIKGTFYYTAIETGETLRYQMFNQPIVAK